MVVMIRVEAAGDVPAARVGYHRGLDSLRAAGWRGASSRQLLQVGAEAACGASFQPG
ncbi:DUF3151 family protein [Brevibacterium aurantiacum]